MQANPATLAGWLAGCAAIALSRPNRRPGIVAGRRKRYLNHISALETHATHSWNCLLSPTTNDQPGFARLTHARLPPDMQVVVVCLPLVACLFSMHVRTYAFSLSLSLSFSLSSSVSPSGDTKRFQQLPSTVHRGWTWSSVAQPVARGTPTKSIHCHNHPRHLVDEINVGPLLPTLPLERARARARAPDEISFLSLLIESNCLISNSLRTEFPFAGSEKRKKKEKEKER